MTVSMEWRLYSRCRLWTGLGRLRRLL